MAKVFSLTGDPLDATFSLEFVDGVVNLVFESRSGPHRGAQARNTDYIQGLIILLERLAARGGHLLDAVVDSQTTRRLGLSPAARRLRLSRHAYPVDLSGISNLGQLRLEISAAQGQTSQSPDARKSGNYTKRIRLLLDLPGFKGDLEELVRFLSAAPVFRPLESEIARAALDEEAAGGFDPQDQEDARRRVIGSIVSRQGQPAFRRALLEAYEGKCAISGCDAEPALEAAHIVPFNGAKTNTLGNGLLLRADLHNLFDRRLISVNPDVWVIVVANRLSETVYGKLAGEKIWLPRRESQRPSAEAVRLHLQNLQG